MLNLVETAPTTQLARYVAFELADRVWWEQLVRAFGTRALERRYEMDKSRHPQACREAFELRKRAFEDWYAGSRGCPH